MVLDRFEVYEEKKKQLIAQVEDAPNVTLQKKNSNLFRKRVVDGKKVDVSMFNSVISIDVDTMVAEVEGMTTFEDFVSETLKKGLLPPIVPQLKTITIGGAISGVGIESTSFRLGLVHEQVLSMEVLTGAGIVECSPSKNKDLFFGLANSYGSIGYILKVRVPLIKAKKYVHIEHLRFEDSGSYFRALKERCERKEDDFIDGTVFSSKEMYITIGNMVDNAPFSSDYKYMKIYYKSIQNKSEDYLTVSDYIWRWDTDWFWCSKVFGAQNWLIRLLFGKWLLKSQSYWAIARWYRKWGPDWSKRGKESVVQDIGIPIENAVSFFEFYFSTINIRPLWICPWLPQGKHWPLFDCRGLIIDFGFWDSVKTSHPDGYYNKLIEDKTEELKGHKSLYSMAYYSEDKFWELYNGDFYFQLKKKYDPKGKFKNLYEKVVLRK